MPNRSLQAKHERAMRQRRDLAFIEYSKTGYDTARPFESDHGPLNFTPAKEVRPKVQASDARKKYIAQRLAGLNPGRPYRIPAKVTPSNALTAAWSTDSEARIVRGPKGSKQ